MPHLAARLGVTDRHLRRIFQQHVGVAPIDYLTTQRLLLAKHLLTDTTMPVTQVALASGFASLRRFNAAFSERYRMNPSALRRARVDGDDDTQRAASTLLRLRLAYRPPYQHEALLRFFAARALDGHRGDRRPGHAAHRGPAAPRPRVGRLDGLALRAAAPRGRTGAGSRTGAGDRRAGAAHRARRWISTPTRRASTPCSPPCHSKRDPAFALPGSFDGFETAARVVLGQQVTVKAARTLTMRLVERFGSTVEHTVRGPAAPVP